MEYIGVPTWLPVLVASALVCGIVILTAVILAIRATIGKKQVER